MNLKANKTFFKKVFWAVFCFIFANFLAALAVPALILPIENLAGRALSYEVLVRLYIIFASLLLAWLITVICWWRPRAIIWHRGLIFSWCAFLALLFVFIFDQRWSLIEEYSWIRYPTAAALFLAALLWLKLAGQNRVNKIILSAFGLLSLGLIFAASDELFLLHERIGDNLQKIFHWPGYVTDFVTVFYGVIGLIVIFFIVRTLNKFLSSAQKSFLVTAHLWGIFLFIAATLFDTLDNQLFSGIQAITDKLVWRGHEFSDFWYIIWQPKFFFNAWEEVLEFFAAVFFALGAYGMTVRGDLLQPPSGQIINPRFSWKQKIILAMSGGAALLVIFLIVSVGRTNDGVFVKIADLGAGLYHTDDLFYHPQWGVVVANESAPALAGNHKGPGVFVLQNGALTRLPDPQNQLRDIDSVTANSKTVYVSDSAQGKIFRYSTGGGWVALSVMKNFPRHPEGLFVDEDDLITVIDESENSITQIFPDGQTKKEYPDHPLFKAPEGIIWHPILKTFLITDDTTGAIFKYTPGQPLEIFVDPRDGLRSPEDIAVGERGEVIVSDNGRREVIIFSAEGRELKRRRFPLLYRDLQGVAVDGLGALFIVSSNGFDNASFISSVLWKIQQEAF
ncbi:MAG: hypothetical protein AAB568_02015 [Patescibacteria group bacterium]